MGANSGEPLGTSGGSLWVQIRGRLRRNGEYEDRGFLLCYLPRAWFGLCLCGKMCKRYSDIPKRTGGHNLPCFSPARRRLTSSPWWGPFNSAGRAQRSKDLCQLSCLAKLGDQLFFFPQALNCLWTLLLCLGIVSKSLSCGNAYLQAWIQSSQLWLLFILPSTHLTTIITTPTFMSSLFVFRGLLHVPPDLILETKLCFGLSRCYHLFAGVG